MLRDLAAGGDPHGSKVGWRQGCPLHRPRQLALAIPGWGGHGAGYRDVDAVDAKLRERGAWVFAGGLHPASTATVVRVKDGDVLTTDGPFAESRSTTGS